MNKIARNIYTFRWLIIILVVLITAFAGYQIPNIQINSDVISNLPDEDKDARLLKEIGNKYGGNSIGMVILEAEDIFRPEILERIAQLTDTIAGISGVYSVTSLSNMMDIQTGEYGMEIGKLIDEYDLPDTQEELDHLRARVMSKDLYRGNLISADGTATVVMFTVAEDADVREVAEAVIQKTEALDIPEKVYYAGSPMMVTSISDLISADLITLIPISFIVIALVLLISFRTARGVILPLLTSAIAIIWTIGIMAISGYEMSMISNNIPIILLAVGSAYTIHVVNRINIERGTSTEKVITHALVYIFIPVLLAALTTMIGFISFIFGSYLTMIRDFGIFTALGTFLSAMLSLTLVPAIVSAMPPRAKAIERQRRRNRKSFMTEYILSPIKRLLYMHPKYTLTAWILLIILSSGGIFMIERSVNIRDYFRKGNPTRVAEDIMVSKFGGSKPVFVLFRGDMQNPEVLQTMMRTQEYMKKSPDILTTQSVVDIIADMNEALGEGRDIPSDRDKIEQLWFLLDGQEYLERFVSSDLSEGIILSKFTSPDNQSKKEFAKYMQEFILENSTETCSIEITGMPFVDVTMDKSLINSQFASLSIAIVFVVIIVGLILRSFIKGLFAIIPIVASIIILFGFMGYLGISLNIGTVLVASVALGIGIDYSIHIISHFDHTYKKGQDIYRSLRDTIMISGKAIIINVLSVSAGFLVLLFSEMVPLEYFGLLIAISMIFSGLGSLTLLPVILILAKRKNLLTKS
ncbi:MAG: MMPL family transporter [Bacteroidetes bacterium]|nr:MMPL family transporter [Bacteroidota bacterium]